MVNYKYNEHEYGGYRFIKSTYGGSWRIHKIQEDGEINVFKVDGFARTLKDAKGIVDKLIKKEKKKKRGKIEK